MAFKIPSKSSISIKDPETLFRDLRDRTVEGLLAQQADMLRKYMEHVDKNDIALELPTGSGKTLVGLLIAEWRRRTKRERCVLLCPTKQLVHQVVEQAKEKYGINALDFSGSARQFPMADKTAFNNCEAIGIATYSALFNTNPFFDGAHTIIFDDAHAAENYVSSFWSLEISRNEDEKTFDAIWQVIAQYTTDNDQLRYDQVNDGSLDTSFVNKIPTPYLFTCKTALTVAIDNACNREDSPDEYGYRWQMIKDHLHACHLYYTSQSILIRPLISPTKSFSPFQNARQRIYMSATLGEGGDLERIFGRKKIERIPAPEGWEKQGIGRRFFVFPMRKWDETTSLQQAISWIGKFDRSLILTPSNRAADIVRGFITANPATQKHLQFNASNLEASKKSFTQAKSAIAILANRYDGIDLIGDECRYLMIFGLPESTNLQERFIISRLGGSVLFNVRIRTRVTQAVGRCTRSSTDYALVVIIGDKVHQYFHRPENRDTLHPELQAEVNFGVEQSNVDNPLELSNNIDIFIDHGPEWKSADGHILETRDELTQSPLPSAEPLGNSVSHEVKFQDALWSGDFESALSSAKDVLACLAGGHELKGYSALWNYLAGSAAYLSNQPQVAQSHFSSAFSCASTLPWLKQMQKLISAQSTEVPVEVIYGERIERIEGVLEKFGKSGSLKVDRYLQAIRDGLASSESKPFEEAQVKLGRILGFESGNTERSGDPDPWWIFGRQGIVFEDYTATGDNPVVSKDKTLQAKAHPDTLSEEHPGVNFSVVMCSSSDKLHHAATPHTGDVFYISVDEFKKFSEECMTTIRVLWDAFQSPGIIEWREFAARKLTETQLGTEEILARLTSTKLSTLA
ncbi:Helicase C-terminal domain-containing protein [Malonomonas rubra DSM 5091]|uniref:Helicase C-terminal domain-containing protein n=1 Tax=Malonomonas rubra DSM 5091 TaxID=1122189 RepID=A0A1M6H2W8_MALRU|nr:DEAD/DEAH box helicase [Malonomonas rubra]SHJ16543.1 Helicase C-terminal domain-containing protein [Malonomonas rubra DSM 5091]